MPTSSPKLELYVEQGKLRYRVSRGSLTPALKQLLSEHKDVLVAALAPPPAGHSEPSPGPAPQNSHNPQNATTPAHSEDSGDCGHPFGSAPTDQGLRRIGVEGTECCRLVTEADDLAAVRVAIDNTAVVGADIETTGLDPTTDRMRLLSLATDTIAGGSFAYLIDCFAVDPAPVFDVLAEKEVIFHNAKFDLAFLTRGGFTPGVVHDTMLLSQLLAAGIREPHGLDACAERELGIRVNKDQQTSNWSGSLTPAQLDYAARDAEVLPPLYRALARKVEKAGLARAAKIEERCLPAVVWMGRHGVGFDRTAWEALAPGAEEQARLLLGKLDAEAPPQSSIAALFGGSNWNWNSHKQVKEVFALLGFHLSSTNDAALAGIDHPLAGLLRQYRSAQKFVSNYGPRWAGEALRGGRIYADWQQIGADSGRMACSKPNLQNLPRDERYRRCFVAPPGRILVKADYSQVELRIAAKVSGDKAMIDAYQAGEDLHTLTARRVLGIGEVTKEHRQLAKAINFGLVYGMGVERFRAYALAQYGLQLTQKEARRYRDAFFAAHPGLRRWHRSIGNPPVDTRTLAGRRRQHVRRYTEKLNTPVQGTGADGLKLALALLWERRDQCPGAFPVLAVHDEIVIEADEDQVEAVTAWLKAAMVDALAPLLAPVPVEVEVKVGRTWGGG